MIYIILQYIYYDIYCIKYKILLLYIMDDFKFNCEKCDYHTDKTQYFSIHKKTKKHQKNYEVELQIEDNKRTSKKYHCNYCNYYTDNHRGMYQHKKSNKHIKNSTECPEKYINKNDYGLIYLIRLSNGYYKFGMSNKCSLDRLKDYNGINKIEKKLLLLSIKNNKECEKILKDNLNDYKYFEGMTKEYFKWNYKNNHKENDKKILEIILKEINNFLYLKFFLK